LNPELAQTFNLDAQGYDTYRPGYPDELFLSIFEYAQLESGTMCLEIGAGTGQATRTMLSKGLNVKALEPGEQLASKLVKGLGQFTQLTVSQTSFEDFLGPPGSYDLIYSASAFHWVPKVEAYRKAFDLLKPNGTLALFWQSFSVNRPDDATHQALQAVFSEHKFGMTEQSHDPERYQRKKNSLSKRGFAEVRLQLFKSERFYTIEQLMGLLSTTSRFSSLKCEQKNNLEHDIRKIMSTEPGVWIDQTCDLYLAKRPVKPLTRDKIQP